MRPESLSSKFSLKSRNKKTGTFRPLFFCLKALQSIRSRDVLKTGSDYEHGTAGVIKDLS